MEYDYDLIVIGGGAAGLAAAQAGAAARARTINGAGAVSTELVPSGSVEDRLYDPDRVTAMREFQQNYPWVWSDDHRRSLSRGPSRSNTGPRGGHLRV